ncbi:MAG: hypothetical protein ACRD12_00330 [Acidimicrobiales bacterium]
MRKRLAALLTVLATLGAVVGIAGSPAANAALSDTPFSGYGTGTVLGLNAVQTATSTLAATNVAHAGAAVNSTGLTAIADELGQNVSPANADKNAYGRGAGAQVGVGTPIPSQADANAINLAGLAQAIAPPPSSQDKSIPINLAPTISATTTRGQAAALWNDDFCPVGRAFSYGEGEAEDVQVLGAGTGSPLISSTSQGQNVTESRSVTYAIPNGDGTFGLVSETRMIVAPINVGPPVLGQALLNIEIAGPLVFKAIATGKPGGASIVWPGTNVITIRALGVVVPPTPIALNSIVGPTGLNLNVPLVANLSVGAPPHAIGGAAGTPVTAAANGTVAAASVDVVLLQLLQGLLGLTAAVDLRVGHIEGAVAVPEGGFTCEIPVEKEGFPDPVTAGEDFTILIRIPSDSALFAELFGCDLIGISVVDVSEVESGNPSFTLTGASNGGVIDGNTVIWDDIGDYHIGDPPIELTITGHIAGNSAAGVIKDTAAVDATLGNCTGTGSGADIVGQGIGTISDTSLSGLVTLIGPDVNRAGGLAATGGDARLLVLGGLFLLGAVAIRRRLHKPGS